VIAFSNAGVTREKLGKKMKRGVLKTISDQAIRLRYKKPGPKPLPADLKKQHVNIALAPHWHETGKRIATEKELSFSAYVERLIYADSLCNESVE
jgi:hypothetical protein